MAEPDRARATTVPPPRIAVYVQHLLGIGHLTRIARVTKALAATGATVKLFSGGVPLPTLDIGRAELVQLLPVRTGPAGFAALVQADGSPFDEQARTARRESLLAAMAAFHPDSLIVEAFPFGRRVMRFELLPLLDQQKARVRPPRIVSSVRDILQESRKPERTAETLSLVDRYFDRILVHGDPAFVSLPASFPAAREFDDKVIYTGLVAPLRPPGPVQRSHDDPAVVVSVGGGAVGEDLINAALAAKPLTPFAQRPWLVLAGPNLPAHAHARLTDAGEGVKIEPFVADLVPVLERAELSVSQAGYNTVADLLVAQCRAVLVPYARDGETEQTTRSARLAELGRAVVVPEDELSASTLAAAISQASRFSVTDLQIDLKGADRAAAAVLEDLSAAVPWRDTPAADR